MHQSDHDKVVETYREQEREKLIDQYMQQAIEASEEYGFLNVMGHEVPDPTVVEPPLGYVQQPDLMELMRRMIRNEVSRAAENLEAETFEEADDFDIDEDPVDYSSPYEMYFEPPTDAPKGPPVPPTPPHMQDPNTPPEPPKPQETPPEPAK